MGVHIDRGVSDRSDITDEYDRDLWAVDTYNRVKNMGVPNYVAAKIPVKSHLNIPFLEESPKLSRQRNSGVFKIWLAIRDSRRYTRCAPIP